MCEKIIAALGTFVLFASQCWGDNGRHRIHDHSFHRAAAEGCLIIQKHINNSTGLGFFYSAYWTRLSPKYPVINSFSIGS